MRFDKWAEKIVAELGERGPLTVYQLSDTFNCLSFTMRMNLNRLMAQGVVVDAGRYDGPGQRPKLYGLADSAPQPEPEPKDPALQLLDELAESAREIGQLYRAGQRYAALQQMKTWLEKEEELKQLIRGGTYERCD